MEDEETNEERNEDTKNQTRMELKYCEHCGGLYVRECGAAAYCANCQGKVDELPLPKKRPGRLMLPVGRRSLLDRLRDEERLRDRDRWRNAASDDENEFEAAGGAA